MRRLLILVLSVLGVSGVVIGLSMGLDPGPAVPSSVDAGSLPTIPADAPSPPVTTTPQQPAPGSTSPEAPPPSVVAPAVPPTDPDLPAANAVPVRSGAIPLHTVPAAAPVGLVIDSIAVEAGIERVGYEPRTDAMEIPWAAGVVGWYEHGPRPGEAGSAVLAAHVDLNGKPGVFYDLRLVDPGDTIEVQFDDGTVRVFEAVARRTYGKDDLPLERIFSGEGRPVLTLVTCGGAFDPTARSYVDNVVVYAVEAGTAAARR